MDETSNRGSLSHLSPSGEARMVDVSAKDVTAREAAASAVVSMRPDVLDALLGGELPKGDGISAARLAAILAVKRTGEWIPLCHPLPVDWVGVDFSRASPTSLSISCTVRTTARTGVEMEALTGAAAAALTIYDMAKAGDKAIVIGPIQLERKTGGASGTYQRTTDQA